MHDWDEWLRKDETDDERAQRVVTETGEVVRKDCLRLARRHNAWILAALRADRQSLAELYYRKPEDWKRDLEDELEWLGVLGLAYRDDQGWWYGAD
jgi:hypothetical protein